MASAKRKFIICDSCVIMKDRKKGLDAYGVGERELSFIRRVQRHALPYRHEFELKDTPILIPGTDKHEWALDLRWRREYRINPNRMLMEQANCDYAEVARTFYPLLRWRADWWWMGGRIVKEEPTHQWMLAGARADLMLILQYVREVAFIFG